MEENITGNGKIIECKGEESSNGQMADNMKDNTLMIKKKDLVFLYGQMERSIEVIGNKENSMDMEWWNLMMDQRRMEFGPKENKLEMI